VEFTITMSSRHRSRLTLALALFCAVLPVEQAQAQQSVHAAHVRQMEHVSIVRMGRSGSPVILLPGLSATRDTWRDIAPILARTHRVYLVQVNGGNLAPGILTGATADLHNFIRSHGLRHAAVVGHSMGGVIGLMLAARHPESVGRLMVVDALPWFGIQLVAPGTPGTVAMVESRAAQLRDARWPRPSARRQILPWLTQTSLP
jgi:pimeloyl-ACP methyl ester carboxylesterase